VAQVIGDAGKAHQVFAAQAGLEVVNELAFGADYAETLRRWRVQFLARDPQVLAQAAGPVILTPHPGEMARLTGKSTEQIQSDRVGAACTLANKLGAIIVLKGAHSVIAAPDGRHWINTSGNPSMATAGMGDALTGIIAGLLAQKIAALTATRLAVFMHGHIADKLIQERGSAPILASEIIERIPEGLRECTA